ncbi:MAG: hypothetical protein JNK85_18915 [Verrucomicrobiales bacterium]|nr:hypothetical protein [Verrucomicrobiales bacterium]
MRWVQRLDVGHPGPQARHCMAYDRDAGVTLLFGTESTSDLWQYDGTNWARLSVTGPRPPDRLDAALAYDPVRKVAVLAGGFGRSANSPLSDTWTFTRTGPLEGRWTRQADLVGGLYELWTQFSETAARDDHRMVFDDARGQVVLFGGDARMQFSTLSPAETFEGVFSSASRLVWSGTEWRREGHQFDRADAQAEFQRLSDFAMIYDSRRGRIILHGGRRTDGRRGETHFETFDGLCELGPNGLYRLASRFPRLNHRMVYDSRRDRYVVFGGVVRRPEPNPNSDIELDTAQPYFEFDPQRPEFPHFVPSNLSSIPRGRTYHDMVYDERRGVTVMVGGQSDVLSAINDRASLETWELRPLLVMTQSLPSRVETCMTEAGELSPRVTLTVEASAPGGVSYAWRRSIAGTTFADPVGTNPARVVRNNEVGTWEVVVSDGCGNSITSSPCLVKVFTPPTVREQPVARQVCPGEALETRVASGTDSLNEFIEKGLAGEPERPVSYQWFRLGIDASGNPDVSGAVAVPGATGPALRFESFRPEDNGYYRCRLANDCGSTFSQAVALTAGAWIRRHPGSVTNEVCSPTSLEVQALGKGPLRFQWRRNGERMTTNDARILGVDKPRLVFESLRYLDDAAYDCIVSDTCNSVTSRVAGVSIMRNPPFLLVDTNGPSARRNHALVYDSRRGVSVLFGGLTDARTMADVRPSDTWEYDGTRWVRRDLRNAPRGRSEFGMAFDAHRGRVVLFGGMTNDLFGTSASSGETWEYDGENWVQRIPSTTNAPAPRIGHALFYDPVRRVTTLYGGDTALVNPRAGDIWTWDGTNWVQREIVGERPWFGGQFGSPARPQMVWDERRGYAVLPPQANNVPGGDLVTWTWNGTNWNPIPTPFRGFGESPALSGSGYGLVYDRYRGEVIYWAGDGNDQERIWRWTGATWRRDDVDPVVGFHLQASAAYDERRHSVVTYGGQYSGNPIPGFIEPGLSKRTFERVLADEPVFLRPPRAVDDPVSNSILVQVVAAGTPPLAYEWQRDGVKLTESFPYAGTTNSTLRVDRGLITDTGRYRCVVRGKCGATIGLATTLSGIIESTTVVLTLATEAVAGRPGLVLSWADTSVVLETAPAPTGPWSVMTSVQSPYRPPVTAPAGFFRLKAP